MGHLHKTGDTVTYYPTPRNCEVVMRGPLSSSKGDGRPMQAPCIELVIDGEDYALTAEHSAKMWANEKTNEYGVGCEYDPNYPDKPVRVGKLVEVALAMYAGLGVDFTYLRGGDDTDFFLVKDGHTWKVDAKGTLPGKISVCRVKWTERAQGMDYFVAGTVADDDATSRAVVRLHGLVTVEEVAEMPDEMASRGTQTWRNKLVYFDRVPPLSALEELLQGSQQYVEGQVRELRWLLDPSRVVPEGLDLGVRYEKGEDLDAFFASL